MTIIPSYNEHTQSELANASFQAQLTKVVSHEVSKPSSITSITMSIQLSSHKLQETIFNDRHRPIVQLAESLPISSNKRDALTLRIA